MFSRHTYPHSRASITQSVCGQLKSGTLLVVAKLAVYSVLCELLTQMPSFQPLEDPRSLSLAPSGRRLLDLDAV